MINRAALDAKRRDFAVLLGNILLQKKPLIYIDETAFQTWSTKQKSWSVRDKPNEHALNTQRHAVTVFGAIASKNCLTKRAIFTMGKSTNSADF